MMVSCFKKLVTIPIIWIISQSALAEVTVYLRPDCPGPSDTIEVIAYSLGLPGMTNRAPVLTISGNDIDITVAATPIEFLPQPTQSTTTIGPLATGNYQLRFYTRYLNSDGSLAAPQLAATRSFIVQENPPPCTPAKVSMASSGLQTTLVSQPFAQPIQVLVQDDKNRPVPGVTVQFSRMYVDEDFVADPNSRAGAASLSASTATTDSMGIASITATADATAAITEYMALVWRPDRQYKTYFILGNLRAQPTEPLTPVVEFGNYELSHYFLTADEAEMRQLDSGISGKWRRTGVAFLASPRGTIANDLQVCRFYGSVNPGPNSHFYTVDPQECAQLKFLQSLTPSTEKRWNYEAIAFDIRPAVSWQCPYAASTPVYRLYNNGFNQSKDSNHRFTTSQNVYQSMTRRGWIAEGVVMCASQ